MLKKILKKKSLILSKSKKLRAFTLIETIVYIVLLSILMTSFIQYLYAMIVMNSKLNNDIENAYNKDSGFGALVAVLLLSSVALVMCMVTTGYAYSFSDFVNRRELRLQASMNAESCIDNIGEELTDDYFLTGKLYLNEFNCEANADLISGGAGFPSAKYEIRAFAELEHVKAYANREINISHTK